MRFRIWLIAAAATLLLVLAVASAAGAAPSSRLGLRIVGLPAGQSFGMTFDSGVDRIGSGTAMAQSGAISNVIFARNLLVVSAASGAPLTAVVTDNLFLSGGLVTGTATVPAGTTVTASFGGATEVALHGVRFSLGAGGGLGALSPTGALVVTCRGTVHLCLARIPIAAGATNRKLTVRLPARGLRLRSVAVAPRRLRGAYDLTRDHYVRDGRAWKATLDAPKGPRGAHITLTFVR